MGGTHDIVLPTLSETVSHNYIIGCPTSKEKHPLGSVGHFAQNRDDPPNTQRYWLPSGYLT